MKKLLKEILEQNDESLPTKLRIVDFDDTLAMTTGKVRSFEEHKAILLKSGFSNIVKHAVSAPFITQVMSAKK